MTEFTTRIQVIDKPNKNNRTYTLKAVVNAIEEAQKRYADRPMLGTLGMPEDALGLPVTTIPLTQVSHTITNLRIEDGYLVGNVKILKTPMGQVLEAMLEKDRESMAFRTFGAGTIDKDGIISHYDIISVSAIRAEDAA